MHERWQGARGPDLSSGDDLRSAEPRDPLPGLGDGAAGDTGASDPPVGGRGPGELRRTRPGEPRAADNVVVVGVVRPRRRRQCIETGRPRGSRYSQVRVDGDFFGMLY